MYICLYVYIYIYIYIEREREINIPPSRLVGKGRYGALPRCEFLTDWAIRLGQRDPPQHVVGTSS